MIIVTNDPSVIVVTINITTIYLLTIPHKKIVIQRSDWFLSSFVSSYNGNAFFILFQKV